MVFSKIKQLLRSLACRTREALWKAMQSVLDRVSAGRCRQLLQALRIYTLHLNYG
jgi:hypothetical protein